MTGLQCHICLGKGRMDDEDRKIYFVFMGISIAVTIVWIVLHLH